MNTTYNASSGVFNNASSFNDSSILSNDESDFPIEEILWVIILLGIVVCGCCLGCYVCYKENKHTKEWAKWVRFKKNGGVLPM